MPPPRLVREPQIRFRCAPSRKLNLPCLQYRWVCLVQAGVGCLCTGVEQWICKYENMLPPQTAEWVAQSALIIEKYTKVVFTVLARSGFERCAVRRFTIFPLVLWPLNFLCNVSPGAGGRVLEDRCCAGRRCHGVEGQVVCTSGGCGTSHFVGGQSSRRPLCGRFR